MQNIIRNITQVGIIASSIPPINQSWLNILNGINELIQCKYTDIYHYDNKDRLKEFLSFKKIGRNKFEERANIATGYVSSKSISISSDVIEKTATLFPDLNIDWLVTGKGEMIKNAEREQKQSKFPNLQ